ncbi:MAG: hypothetical protein AAB610_03280 [Patescibacteria group bacterium]
MNHSKMLAFATKIAQLLMSSSRRLAHSTIRDQGLMGTLSVMLAAESREPEALNPEFQDIILFGSVAEGNENPSDVDIIVLDRGFYSNVLTPSRKAQYGALKDNLRSLFTGWFGFEENSKEVVDTNICKVDLLVLSAEIFTDPDILHCFAHHQTDPEFFKNAFSNMMRFNPFTGSFEKVDLSYFEQKYGVSLPHLRKTEEVV